MAKRRKKKCLQPFWEQQWLFRKCVQSCGWRAVGWIDALRFEIERKKTGRVLNLTRIPEVLRYPPFVLQNMVFRSWDFFVFPKIIDWLTCTPSCTTRRWEKSSKFKTITFLKLFWFSEMTGQFLIFLNVFSNTKNVTNLKIEKPDTQFSGFFFPWSLSLFRSFQHGEKYREVEPKRTRS